jgi:hypothetical protein
MDVAAVNLVAWQHGVVLAAIVLKAEVRAAGDRHLRAMVSALLPEFRDLEELMAERALAVDHTTIWRWTHPTARRSTGGCTAR